MLGTTKITFTCTSIVYILNKPVLGMFSPCNLFLIYKKVTFNFHSCERECSTIKGGSLFMLLGAISLKKHVDHQKGL